MNHNRTRTMHTSIDRSSSILSSAHRATVVSLLCLALLAWGCGDRTGGTSAGVRTDTANRTRGEVAKENGGDEETTEEHEHEGDAIEMTEAMMKDAGITVQPVIMGPMSAAVSAPGRVVPTQEGIAHVGTVVPGRIARLLVSEGSFVGRGTALAEIEAFDIGQFKGEYVTAQANVEQTRAALARQEKLSGEAIGAKRSVEEARSAYAHAVASLRSSESKLRAAGINPASITSSGAFSSRVTLRSPINGVVARRSAVLGEYIEPNRDVFEILNTSTVWIDAQVNPALVGTLRIGDPAFVRDRTEHRHAGTIRFIAPNVDPESRTITVRTEVVNPDAHLRPESFATVEFERAASGEALVVPDAAIERRGSECYVYRQTAPGRFERVLVEVGSRGGDRVVITNGLNNGDRIAVTGLFYLKSARQKGELEEHEH
jgi:cobalt-zinc-cadmium efflux system membrane fusion protein